MYDKKERIKKLVDRYEKLSDAEKKKYNEQQTKDHFIRPLFEALGWDFTRDVWSETDVHGKRVDYAFMVGSITKFFVEAKSLKVDLDIETHAKQAINYAWNKGVNWAVLTDFESVKVFNAMTQSRSLLDKLVFEIPYKDFISDFDRLWLLSKESFKKNSLEEYAVKYGKKLKKLTVNEKLYSDFKIARQILTKSFGIWNENLDQELLEEGVQRILDRLVFIRVLEDRKLEDPILIPIVREWEANHKRDQLFPMLTKKFRELDHIYNSNLFQKHACEDWEEYDDSIKKVILMLYGFNVYEYDFKEIPADILGGVYESYLGYIAQNPIEIDKEGNSGKLLKSENKKEIKEKSRRKRKEQGIYYTPKFIVDYIVKNTLGKKLAEVKSMHELKKIKVLDPACGSGSFLTKALKTINDKYKDFGNPGDQRTKSEILLSNIYGVDLDPQAVELAKLNLLIEALDKKAKLPDLTGNVRVGNSLISGSEKKLKKYFGKDWRDKRPFNWEEEFPFCHSKCSEESRGFDVVIGNPPYVFARGGSFNKDEKKYFYDYYKLLQYQLNTFLLFIERGMKLLKDGGYFGFIIPNNWLTINSFSTLREYLLKNVADLKIINAVDTVFGQANVDTCILVFKKDKPTKIELGELKDGNLISLNKFNLKEFYENNFVINIAKFKNGKNNKILDKFKNSILLGDIAIVKSGLKAYEVGKGTPKQTTEMKDNRIYHSKNKVDNSYLPYLEGRDVQRYIINWGGQYLKYGDCLAAPRKKELFVSPRILVRQIPAQPPYCINGVFTDKEYLNDINSMVIFNPVKEYDLKYILGVINSRPLSYWFIHTFDKFQRKIFPQFKVNELAKFPICPANKKQQKEIVVLVDKILKLNKQLQSIPKNSEKWTSVKKEIEKVDEEIDEKVFELYGLERGKERKIINTNIKYENIR